MKKTHVRENFGMETAGTTTFTNQRRISISWTTLCLLAAFFICSIVATSFMVYNFVACPDIDQRTVCARGGSSPNLMSVHHQHNDNRIIPLAPISHDEKSDETKIDVRLPRSIIPVSYNIKLIPFLTEGNFTFRGSSLIRIKVLDDSQNITLHAVDLKINREDLSVKLLPKEENVAPIRIRSQYPVESKQFYVIELYETLKKDSEYEIQMDFTGQLFDFLQGFYRSSYVSEGATKWLAATQFQPTDARRAFPCFDEPSMKAKFNLSIARPIGMSSISNMPRVPGDSKPVTGLDSYVWDVYQESVPMSTYLVAFVVSDFANSTSGNFSVWARRDAIASAQYALRVGPKILKFLEEFFGIEFPLPKIDMIALPDFHAGAMENWGLITYRETAMLYEAGVSTSGIKQRVATVVAHELAHQWFGNLVTPSWWSDIWLNEGFASYMEYLGVDAIEPSWKPMDQFIVNEMQNVFTLDALSSSHKISVEVDNPDEINEIFDRISYGKGAAIIRMMSHFLTSDVFRQGLKKYLLEMSYKSAEQDDLWQFLTEAAQENNVFDNETTVKVIMDTWTLQTGFPVVSVMRHKEEGSFSLSQNRFVYSKTNCSQVTGCKQPVWWIPITYTLSRSLNFQNTRPSHWMRNAERLKIADPYANSTDFFIFNIQQTGYYRVNYEDSNWKMIISFLRNKNRFKEIAPANRAQLVDDALNLARGGYLNYKTALDVTLYLSHEDDYVPWKAAITALNLLDSMLIREGDYYLFKRYVLHLMDSVYKNVGFNDTKDSDDMLNIYKRIDVLTAACHLGLKDCIFESRRLYKNWMAELNPDLNNPIPPNLKSIVYCTAIKHGTELEWNFAYERFLKTTISSEKEVILSSLGCSREVWILTQFLRRSLSDEHGIRKQDVFRVFAAVSNNVIGQEIVFNYIRKHWTELKEYLGSVMANLNSMVKYSTRRMNTRFELEELKRFVETHYKDAGRSIQQAIERVEINVEWMDKNYSFIIDWLQNLAIEN